MSWADALSKTVENVTIVLIVTLTFGFATLFFGWPVFLLIWVIGR